MITVITLCFVAIIKWYVHKQPLVWLTNNNDRDVSDESFFDSYMNWCSEQCLKMPVANQLMGIFIFLFPVVMLSLLTVSVLTSFLDNFLGELIISVIYAAIIYFFQKNIMEKINDPYSSVLISAHEQVFGIIFWYLVLGICGSTTYWLLVLGNQHTNVSFQRLLIRIHGFAAWVPARITGLLYALVGNFSSGFHCWLSCMGDLSMNSSQVLLCCGQASLESITDDEKIALAERAFNAWIILSILFALAICMR